MKSTLLVMSVLMMGWTQTVFADGAGGPPFSIGRCGDDQLLNGPNVEGRVKWGRRCSSKVDETINDWIEYASTLDLYNPLDPATGKRKYDDPEKKVFEYVFGGKVLSFYPSFGHQDKLTPEKVYSAWGAPITNAANCDMPADVAYRFMCPAGCYTSDQAIWFEDGHQNIGSVKKPEGRSLMTLDADATLDNLKFSPRDLVVVVSDAVATEQTAYVISMASGGELKVTANHPLIASEGYMRRADSLKTGDSLVRADGKLDKIISIEKRQLNMRAYNVVTGTFNKTEKIVVAQGYLSGDLYYQNAGVDFINRMVIRSGSWLNEGNL